MDNISPDTQRTPSASSNSADHGLANENAPPSGPQQNSHLGQSPPDTRLLSSSVVSHKLQSPSTMSPSRHGAGWDLKADLPLLPSVSSASQLPLPASRTSSISMSSSSIAVFEQSRTLLDKQRNAAEHERQTFAAERALWDLERQALYARVQELEQALNIKNGQTVSKQSSAVSPTETGQHLFGSFSNVSQGGVDSLGSFSHSNGSRHTSMESNGDEFWRGAGARKGSVATRTFSDSSARSSKAEDRRLPSIAETESPDKPSGILSTSTNRIPSTSSNGPKLNKDFDGIRLKSVSQLPEHAVLTPESPSPKQVASPPGHIQIPSSGLSAPEDILTKDAGHTPLVRLTDPTDDLSAVASNSQTPTQEGPWDPRPSVAYPPSERSDSYFPPPPEDAHEDGDEDPELKGPLTLQDNGQNDKAFLDELDSKLTDAARSTSHDSIETTTSENRGPTRTESEPVRSNFNQPEHEPMLRMRRSMNFGAPLGVARPGML